jgi:hypothetical protein
MDVVGTAYLQPDQVHELVVENVDVHERGGRGVGEQTTSPDKGEGPIYSTVVGPR